MLDSLSEQQATQIEDWVSRLEHVAESLATSSMETHRTAEQLYHLPGGMREAAGTMLAAAQRMRSGC